MNRRELKAWIVRLDEAPNDGRVACDFAEMIWNGTVSESQQCELLSSPITRVREVTAWAIADLARDGIPIRTLFCVGPDDRSERVRLMTAFALKESAFLSQEEINIIAERLGNDKSANVLATLAEITARDGNRKIGH